MGCIGRILKYVVSLGGDGGMYIRHASRLSGRERQGWRWFSVRPGVAI